MGTTHIQREIQKNQMRIEIFLEINFPNKEIELEDEHVEYLKRTLDTLNTLHAQKKTTHRWQEFLASYEILRHGKGDLPSEAEVAKFMGLKDKRIKDNNWMETVNKIGYNIELAPRALKQKRENVRKAYEKLKSEKAALTVRDVAGKAGISFKTTKKYLKEMGLETSGIRAVKKNRNEKRFLKAYRELDGETHPTKESLICKTGLSASYVQRVCARLSLPYASDSKTPQAEQKITIKPTTESVQRNILDVVREAGLDYFMIRDMISELARRGEVYQSDGGNDYLNFIRNNMAHLCQRMRIEPPKNAVIEKDNLKNEYGEPNLFVYALRSKA
jgi:predicted transcriptional regulator